MENELYEMQQNMFASVLGGSFGGSLFGGPAAAESEDEDEDEEEDEEDEEEEEDSLPRVFPKIWSHVDESHHSGGPKLIKLQLLLTKIAKQMIPKLPWRTSQCIAGIYQYYVHIWDVQQGVRLWPTIIWSQTSLYW